MNKLLLSRETCFVEPIIFLHNVDDGLELCNNEWLWILFSGQLLGIVHVRIGGGCDVNLYEYLFMLLV